MDILTILMGDLRKEMMCKMWNMTFASENIFVRMLLLTVTVALVLS